MITGLKPGSSGRARGYERFCTQVIDAVADEAVARDRRRAIAGGQQRRGAGGGERGVAVMGGSNILFYFVF